MELQHTASQQIQPTYLQKYPEDQFLSPHEREELTISALLSLSAGSLEKRCRYKLCHNEATKRSPFCTEHLGSRVCEVINCKKYAQGGTQFCISHGGGHRCTFQGCAKGARGKYFCALHGGGRRCNVPDCHKLAVGGSGNCAAHGGGKKCCSDGCNKAAQSPTNYCVRHGGGRKCQVLGCSKVSRGKTGYCASHGHAFRDNASTTSENSESISKSCNSSVSGNNSDDAASTSNAVFFEEARKSPELCQTFTTMFGFAVANCSSVSPSAVGTTLGEYDNVIHKRSPVTKTMSDLEQTWPQKKQKMGIAYLSDSALNYYCDYNVPIIGFHVVHPFNV